MLSIENVYMNYHAKSGETHALANINLHIEKGEFVSIVGPSGCGKSTLLSIIAGLLEPSAGRVMIKGDIVNKPKKEIGYMLQRDHLFEWRNILQNALLGLEILGELSPENISYTHFLLDKYGLGEFKKMRPSELSGGMRQRAALIRTLATRPEILLLDEPFSALDYQVRLNVSREIHEILQKEEKTAILVTHDISEAIALSDRVAILSARPSYIKSIQQIDFGTLDPIQKRESAEFPVYFNKIWKELEIDEPGA